MGSEFEPVVRRERLHTRITRVLAQRVIESERGRKTLAFPKEADLCQQLGVSRTVLRESMKVLADKGMIEMKPRAGTRARPHSQWRRLDPDILRWQAEANPAPSFLRQLCEVRLAIEPTAAGFAAVRATRRDIAAMERCLEERTAVSGMSVDQMIDLDLRFHALVVAASHNPLLEELSATIRPPIRAALSYTSKFPATVKLGIEARGALLEAIRRRDPMASRRAAEEVVGLAMLAVEKVVRAKRTRGRGGKKSGAP